MAIFSTSVCHFFELNILGTQNVLKIFYDQFTYIPYHTYELRDVFIFRNDSNVYVKQQIQKDSFDWVWINLKRDILGQGSVKL